jgi:hypothetical protein
MSSVPGISHDLPDNESENTKRLRAQGIIETPQIELGSQIRLDVKGNLWSGFVLSIDRFASDNKFIVYWSIQPSNAVISEKYGLFRFSQASYLHGDTWEIKSSTVPLL